MPTLLPPRLMLGDPLASLPILNFALLKYSRHVAAYVLFAGVEVSSCVEAGNPGWRIVLQSAATCMPGVC
jgi:hypothetical protein